MGVANLMDFSGNRKNCRAKNEVSTKRHARLVDLILRGYGLPILHPEAVRSRQLAVGFIIGVALVEGLIQFDHVDIDFFEA